MDYEKKYKEALERCKEWASGTWGHSVDDSPKDIAEFIFPQLAESEDERIRKWLLEQIHNMEFNEDEYHLYGLKAVEYLEKQKDASKAIEAVDRIDKYIDEHLANAHDMKDSNPDKKYYRGWDDALGKMAGILQDVYSEGKQKEQKPVKDKIIEDTISYLSGGMHFYNSVEELKYRSNLAYRLKSLRPAKQEWSEEDKSMLLSIVNAFRNGTVSTIGQEQWLKSLPERFNLHPKVEWNEEDEKTIKEIEFAVYQMPTHRQDTKNKCLDFLKSLRPSWKPSEEHLSALLAIFNDPDNIGSQTCQLALADLYEQLKKLYTKK